MPGHDNTETVTTRDGVKILEFYGSFEAPFEVVSLTKRLLENIPSPYVGGLDAVVLTDVTSLSRDRRRLRTRGGYKLGKDRVAGLYHAKTADSGAWIEIFVDRTAAIHPLSTWKVPFVRDFLFGEILFHELGHHIHATARPEYRDLEAVAEDWARRLNRMYLRKRYWYLWPLAWMMRVVQLIGSLRKGKAKS